MCKVIKEEDAIRAMQRLHDEDVEAYGAEIPEGFDSLRAIEALKELPVARPERKTGRWIDGHCSECGCDVPAYIEGWRWVKDMNARFCPMCGALMKGGLYDRS